MYVMSHFRLPGGGGAAAAGFAQPLPIKLWLPLSREFVQYRRSSRSREAHTHLAIVSGDGATCAVLTWWVKFTAGL